jgi:hypothetical protein
VSYFKHDPLHYSKFQLEIIGLLRDWFEKVWNIANDEVEVRQVLPCTFDSLLDDNRDWLDIFNDLIKDQSGVQDQ